MPDGSAGETSKPAPVDVQSDTGGVAVDTGPKSNVKLRTVITGLNPQTKPTEAVSPPTEAVADKVIGSDGAKLPELPPSPTRLAIEGSTTGPHKTMEDLAAGKLSNQEPPTSTQDRPPQPGQQDEKVWTTEPVDASKFTGTLLGDPPADGTDPSAQDAKDSTQSGRAYQEADTPQSSASGRPSEESAGAKPPPSADGRSKDKQQQAEPAQPRAEAKPQPKDTPPNAEPAQPKAEAPSNNEAVKEPELTTSELIAQAHALAEKFGDKDPASRDMHVDIAHTLTQAKAAIEDSTRDKSGKAPPVDSKALLAHLDKVAKENAVLAKNATADSSVDYKGISTDAINAMNFIKLQNEDPKAVRTSLEGKPPPKTPDAGPTPPEQSKESEANLEDLKALAERFAEDADADYDPADTEEANKARTDLYYKYKFMANRLDHTANAIAAKGTGGRFDRDDARPLKGESLVDFYARKAAENQSKFDSVTDDTWKEVYKEERDLNLALSEHVKEWQDPDAVKDRLNAPKKKLKTAQNPDSATTPDANADNKADGEPKKTLEERHKDIKDRMEKLGIKIDSENKANLVNAAIGSETAMTQLEAIIDAAAGKGDALTEVLPEEVIAALRNEEFGSLADMLQAAEKSIKPGSKNEGDIHWVLKVLVALGLLITVSSVVVNTQGQKRR